MNNAQIVESNNFPALFQDYGKQLYEIRSQMLHFYNKINEFDLTTMAESSLEELYEIFSELDTLGHLDVDNEMCEFVLRDPVIQSLLPAVHSSYSSFFSLHETQLARKILNHENPWKMLESFPLYPRYENLINVHVRNSPRIEVLAFIGCGPLPVTLLLFSKLYGIRCIGIDKDPEAVTLAKRCVKHFGLEKEIIIVEGDETVLAELEWDSVLIAGLAEPKARIFQNLHNIIKRRKSESKKLISVCYRNYTGMRQLLYWPVRPEHSRGFQKISEIPPTGGANNTLVFLECE
ncbi:methyltransferase [Methanosarcina sp. Ant1]|nr:methyltransferase [Methanosarcina sp. Ant1]